MDQSGQTIEEGLVQSLGMDETVPWNPPPEMPPDCLKEMVRQATDSARQRWGVEGEFDGLFIWCKYAEGKLQFTIGDQSVDLSFSGWTRTLEAPPFICPHSEVSSFHIAATDDGRIAAAEGIRTCAETGRRVLADELVTCEATGKAVVAEATQLCPVTERPVLERELVTCSACHQRVSPTIVEGGQCLACRSTQPIAKDATPLAKLLGEHVRLNRWPKWTASETANVYVLIAAGWWKRLLLVIDKTDWTVQHAAVGHRFGTGYASIDVEQIDAL
jgi:hypothetical protein